MAYQNALNLWFTISKWLVCKPILSSYIIHPGLCKNVLGRNGSECTRLKKPGAKDSDQRCYACLAGTRLWVCLLEPQKQKGPWTSTQSISSLILGWEKASRMRGGWTSSLLYAGLRTVIVYQETEPFFYPFFKGPTHKDETCPSP